MITKHSAGIHSIIESIRIPWLKGLSHEKQQEMKTIKCF